MRETSKTVFLRKTESKRKGKKNREKYKYHICKYKQPKKSRAVVLVTDTVEFTENQKTRHRRKCCNDKG